MPELVTRYRVFLASPSGLQEIRDAFRVLHRYPFYYHGLFIYGNVGETPEEMLSIADFAKDIEVESIYTQPLQQRRFSPIKELVDQTPGYYLDPKGFVCSEMCDMDKLRRIGKLINRRFYTPVQCYRILKKLYHIRMVTLTTPLIFLPLIQRLPQLLSKTVSKHVKKARGAKKVGIPYA